MPRLSPSFYRGIWLAQPGVASETGVVLIVDTPYRAGRYRQLVIAEWRDVPPDTFDVEIG